MSSFTINEFEPVSSRQWKQKIQYDLKGADYNDTLVWQSLEGIHVKPFYHRDEFENGFDPIPCQPNHWNITQAIYIDDASIANKLAIKAIERGAEAIYFSASEEFDPQTVFDGFPFGNVKIYFDLKFFKIPFQTALIKFLSRNEASAYYNIDLLGNLARNGNWFSNLAKDHEDLETIIKTHPSEAILSIDMGLYQNAGANMVQQLAYGLAQVNEYLNHFESSGVLNHTTITFKVAVGSNYFFEIAKIRALRKLYATLAKEYNLPEACHIIAFPSKRNKTLYDYNCNMLRTTTECMSAILGGADSICNLPYDAIYHKSNEFGERISRNQLLILKSESYFDRVSNPSDGSYYIENLTVDLATRSLELFKDIENSGGLLAQLKAGTIQKKIKEAAQKEQDFFDKGEIVLVGTNKYENEMDRMKDDLELFPFMKRDPRKTLIEPVIEKRIAESVEQNRLKDE